MKRLILTLSLLMTVIAGALAQNDAVYVYRNDSEINAFLKTDVDSVVYSQIGLDSLTHSEYVVQEIWTVDSVYRIPLEVIDSVSFVTPPTVYKSGVIKLSENLIDYIIGAENQTLRLKTSTPSHLIPQTGDKLVLLEGCEVLPNGFAGKVESVNMTGECIDVVCGQTYIEDIFDSFCSVQTILGYADNAETDPSQNHVSGVKRVVYNPQDRIFHLGPFTVSASGELSQNIIPNGELAQKGEKSCSITLEPMFRIHTFLFIGEGHGLYVDGSITGSLSVSTKTSIYGGLEWEHEFLNPVVNVPVEGTAGMINFYINPGLFLRANLMAANSIIATKKYSFSMAFGYSSKGEKVTSPSIDGKQIFSTIDMEGSFDGSLALGAYFETGFNIMSREYAKACVRGECGLQACGNFVLRNSDIDNADKKTELYEKLKASSVEIGPFANVSLSASTKNPGVIFPAWQLSETYEKWDIVPTFSNTQLAHTSGSSTSTDAYSELTGNCISPVPVGYKLFDGENNEVADYDAPVKYTNTESRLEHSFTGLIPNKKYIVYPKVKLFGHDILAAPSAELDNTYHSHSCPDNNHPHAIDLGLPSGTKWCCCNVGASTPEGYGGYYAWGETSEKSLCKKSNYAFYDKDEKIYINIGSDISGTRYDVAHVLMGSPWRMPTHEQIMELVEHCEHQWTQQNGVLGVLVTGPNGGLVFIPATGGRRDDGLVGVEKYGRYWSGSLGPNYDCYSHTLLFGPNGVWDWYDYIYRYNGHPVRPVCP